MAVPQHLYPLDSDESRPVVFRPSVTPPPLTSQDAMPVSTGFDSAAIGGNSPESFSDSQGSTHSSPQVFPIAHTPLRTASVARLKARLIQVNGSSAEKRRQVVPNGPGRHEPVLGSPPAATHPFRRQANPPRSPLSLKRTVRADSYFTELPDAASSRPEPFRAFSETAAFKSPLRTVSPVSGAPQLTLDKVVTSRSPLSLASPSFSSADTSLVSAPHSSLRDDSRRGSARTGERLSDSFTNRTERSSIATKASSAVDTTACSDIQQNATRERDQDFSAEDAISLYAYSVADGTNALERTATSNSAIQQSKPMSWTVQEASGPPTARASLEDATPSLSGPPSRQSAASSSITSSSTDNRPRTPTASKRAAALEAAKAHGFLTPKPAFSRGNSAVSRGNSSVSSMDIFSGRSTPEPPKPAAYLVPTNHVPPSHEPSPASTLQVPRPFGHPRGPFQHPNSSVSSFAIFSAGKDSWQDPKLAKDPNLVDASTRDRYGFKKVSHNVTMAQHDAWNTTYARHLERRKIKWINLMKSSGFKIDNPVEFPARSDKVKRYVRKGIPPEWRGNAWFYYAGGLDRLEAEPGLYQKALTKASQPGCLSESDSEHIERDLNRTFPDNLKFKPESTEPNDAHGTLPPPQTLERSLTMDTPIICSLRRVLQAFAVHSPKTGYCQSLNFLAGLLLLFLNSNEEKVFTMLNIITTTHLPGTHGVSLEGANVDIGVLMSCIEQSMPAVWAKINDNRSTSRAGITVSSTRLPTVSLATTAWFMSCFVGTLPVETVLRVWDSFFYEGSKTLFRIALAIFKTGEPEIRAISDPMEIFQVVQNIPRKLLDANALMETCFKRRNGFGHLSQETIDRRRQERRDMYAQERAAAIGSNLAAGAVKGGGVIRTVQRGAAAHEADERRVTGEEDGYTKEGSEQGKTAKKLDEV